MATRPQASAVVDTSSSPHAARKSLPFEATTLTDGFWSRWQNLNRSQALAYGHEQLVASGVMSNFEIAAGRRTGGFQNMRFADSDLYKWLEGAAFALASEPEPELARRVDAAIELLAAAQQADGYLDTFYQLTDLSKRWTNLRDSHELYCAGHLFQAAVAHFRATGSESLLLVARRFADHIDSVFGTERLRSVPGHPEVEMGLVELYRACGERRYLDLARFFVDERGRGLIDGRAYNQDHVPVREAREMAGHAVRQLYLLAGVADVYLETGETALLEALDRLWQDMTMRKMSITGGVGSRYHQEAFGESYELPNDRCYNETCAQIAGVMWNWRMLLATGECRFADLMEWTLYNGVVSGVSLDGRSYFYPNALLSRGAVERSGWFACACCPPNVTRTLASVHNYAATQTEAGVQIHLYDGMVVRFGDSTRLRVETKYPWEAKVTVRVEAASGGDWTLSLRIPGWCHGATVATAGGARRKAASGGYIDIRRSWKPGETVVLELPMPAVFHEAHPYVEGARGCVALSRGPMVYCFEGHDQSQGVAVLDAAVAPSGKVAERWDGELLGGVVTLTVPGRGLDRSEWEGALYRPARRKRAAAGVETVLTGIPYYAWANRGPAQMSVWMPRG